MNVTISNGKYTIIQDGDGKLKALRYGEEWRDCTGDGLIYSLAAEIQRLREKYENPRNLHSHKRN